MNAQSTHVDTAKVTSAIRREVTESILEYRTYFNPGLPEDSLRYRAPTGEILYKQPRKALFKQPLDSSWYMVLAVTPWPKNQPWFNHYLVTKKNNRFTNGKDTLSFPEYDLFNGYFPFDDRFVVYFDPHSNDMYNLSGNFVKDKPTEEWLNAKREAGAIMMVQKTLAQYDISDFSLFLNTKRPGLQKHIYDSLRKLEPDYYYLHIANSTLSDSYVMVKMPVAWPYTKFDILYYTNRPELTGSKDPKDLYEVKYTIDYTSGSFPENYKQTQFEFTKVSHLEYLKLQRKFLNTLSLFFSGDPNGSYFDLTITEEPVDNRNKKNKRRSKNKK
jgi:hypothetical protein